MSTTNKPNKSGRPPVNNTFSQPSTPSTRVIQIGGGNATTSGAAATVQSRLDDASFAKYIDGFEVVRAEDLLEAKGGRVRYVIEDLDSRGNVVMKKFRLGGWLNRVDPQLRFLRLFNPYAKKTWSVQLATPRQRVRLYYMAPGTSDEVAMMRKLLQQLENGDITIRKSS
jgi:hypothetical protein